MTRPKDQPKVRFGNYVTTHGMTNTTEYTIWSGIVKRCNNPKCKIYPYYGGRGISVCTRWFKFEDFLADVGRRPSRSHSLDRYPDQNGNYEPGNVRWATRSEQMRNKRDNRLVTHNGKTLCITAWAEELGMSVHTLRRRVTESENPSIILRKPDRIRQRKST